MREHSSKRYDPEIILDRLYYQLSEKWMKERQKKKVKEYYIVSPWYVKVILILVAIFSIYISFKKPKGKTKSFYVDNGAQSFKKQKVLLFET